MSEIKHTPLPWKVNGTYSAHSVFLIGSDGRQVASSSWHDDSPHYPTRAATYANFRLIEEAVNSLAAKDAEIAKLRSDRNLFKGKYRALLKLVSRTRDKLVHVTDHIQDEGDRRYFGSTNDADELVSLFHTMESWVWDALDETNRMKRDPCADIREQRARAERAEGEIEKLADKIEDLIAEFGDDPKAALECVSEHLQLRRQPVQEEV